MIGRKVEHEGIVKHGSKMIQAVSNATVPQFSVIVGGSYGAGNYAMCGRAYDPRLLFSWVNSRIAVMGGEQAAGVLVQLRVAAMKARGQTPNPEQLEAMRREVVEQFEAQSSAYYATARLWDDGIIDPRDTRRVLAIGISMSYNSGFANEPAPRYGVFRM